MKKSTVLSLGAAALTTTFLSCATAQKPDDLKQPFSLNIEESTDGCAEDLCQLTLADNPNDPKTLEREIKKPTAVYDVYGDTSLEELLKKMPEYKRNSFFNELLSKTPDNEGIHKDPKDNNRIYAVACDENPDYKKEKDTSHQRAKEILIIASCSELEGSTITSEEFRQQSNTSTCTAVTGDVICSLSDKSVQLMKQIEEAGDDINKIKKVLGKTLENSEK